MSFLYRNVIRIIILGLKRIESEDMKTKACIYFVFDLHTRLSLKIPNQFAANYISSQNNTKFHQTWINTKNNITVWNTIFMSMIYLYYMNSTLLCTLITYDMINFVDIYMPLNKCQMGVTIHSNNKFSTLEKIFLLNVYYMHFFKMWYCIFFLYHLHDYITLLNYIQTCLSHTYGHIQCIAIKLLNES